MQLVALYLHLRAYIYTDSHLWIHRHTDTHKQIHTQSNTKVFTRHCVTSPLVVQPDYAFPDKASRTATMMSQYAPSINGDSIRHLQHSRRSTLDTSDPLTRVSDMLSNPLPDSSREML